MVEINKLQHLGAKPPQPIVGTVIIIWQDTFYEHEAELQVAIDVICSVLQSEIQAFKD